MKLQTEVEIPKYNFSIDHSMPLFLIGSCFSASIGEKFKGAGFDSCYNPLGTLYNGSSIAQTLKLLQSSGSLCHNNLFCDGDIWGDFRFSTLFSSNSRDEVVKLTSEGVEKGREALRKAEVIFITLGTSWVYRHIESGEIVANCHKLPSKMFKREFMSHTQTFNAIKELFSTDFYSDKKIVITVSPVRHAKDGFIENSRSKAHLLIAAGELVDHFSNVFYFPSYEIFMDELRDYRFYESDMIHPSAVGVEVVWNRILSAFMGDKTKLLINKIESVKRDLSHKPKYPNSDSFAKFRASTTAKVEAIEKELGRKLELL